MKEQAKKWKENPIIIILFGIFLLIFYQIIFPLIYFQLLKPLLNSQNFWVLNLTYLGNHVLIMLFLIFLFRKSLKKEWKEFWKQKKEYTKTALSAWGKGILLMILSNIIIASFIGDIAGNEAQNREIIQLLPLFSIITMCVIGPFIEEIVFRKIYKNAFKTKYSFIIFTTLLFASLHVLNGFETLTIECIANNWQQLLYLLPYSSLAIFFALAYYETNNIFTSVVAHCFHNTISICLILLASFL